MYKDNGQKTLFNAPYLSTSKILNVSGIQPNLILYEGHFAHP
jgi:hypothetical protein